MREETALRAMEETAGTENEKNVRLTVVGLGNENQDDELTIDLGVIGAHMKRLFALWLCFALGLGALSCAAALTAHCLTRTSAIQSLVSFAADADAEENIRKIKSPGVVEAALNELGLPMDNLEDIRACIDIHGVIPDKAYDKMSLYYNIVSKGANPDAVESLLDTSYELSTYVVSFRYAEADFTSDGGIDFMNALLRSYQTYFAKTYNYNMAMGNPLSAIDYKDYDYAEAVDIFSAALNSITSYLSAVESASAMDFRSAETGFTFQDLRRAVATLRDVDLDRISSYIVIHSVSKFDAETEVSYYEWRIEELTRQRAIARAKLASLSKSIEDYEKDPVLIATQQDGASTVASTEGVNENYDAMIREKLDTQASISSCTRSISYYESVIEGFRVAEESASGDIETTEAYLASLNEKVNALISSAVKTTNEYYERVAFSNRVRVLVPAVSDSSALSLRNVILAFVAVEALVFFAYCAIALVQGARESRESGRIAAEEKRRKS